MTDEQAIQLVRAIRDHSGLELDSIRDAGRYGADSGFGGFTYTTDGAEFYREHSALIDELLQTDADNLGEPSVSHMIAGFGRVDMAETREGRECLLAWYALEQAGQWLVQRQEER